jgi:DNA-binding PadR family transcriptional regulator
MAASAELLPGTLDLLILKAVSLGQLHGYGMLLRIEQISGGALQISRVRSTPRSTASSTRG